MSVIPALAVVVNLARRPDRLAAFQDRWARASVGVPVVVFPAIEGGDAGCLASHIAVLSTEYSARPLLVMEDDCCFAPGFTLDLDPPADWDVLWLGGQHHRPPRVIDETWCRPRYMTRTHAYITRRPHQLAALLRAMPEDRLDPSMASLVCQQYALRQFTCGQTAGLSDIDGYMRDFDDYWQWGPRPYGRPESMPRDNRTA